MGRSRAAVGLMKEPAEKSISQQDRRNLKTLADDFGLLHRKEVQDIIENCTSYEEGQRKIMRVYTAVYLK